MMQKDWSHIENPWKGLEPYGIKDLIYGRDEEIQSLYSRILYCNHTVVYGKSGVGKSSIINAGIIPKALLDGLFPVYIRLAHTPESKKPFPAALMSELAGKGTSDGTIQSEKQYAVQVREAIMDALEEINKNKPDQNKIKYQATVTINEDTEETLWTLLHRLRFYTSDGKDEQTVRPLLIFDQFEEIFTLERDRQRVIDFFHQLADLINDVKPEIKTAANSPATDNDLMSRLGVARRPDYMEGNEYTY